MEINKLMVGAHASIGMGLDKALQSINAMGGNSVQIFLKSPRSRHSKPLDEDNAKLAKKYLEENNMFLVGHCSYLLNFAKDYEKDSWPVDSLIDDMDRIEKCGGVGVVLHIGKYLDMEKEVAFANIKKAVSYVIANTKTKVIFENTAGQGTEIGFRFEELKEIYDMFSDDEKKRIGFCLDTCHSFAAGYDLSNGEGVKNWFEIFDEYFGWDKVVCIHFNDAKKECGSRVDRHQDIGKGFIGENGLKQVAQLAKNTNKPLILETTTEFMTYPEQIVMIKGWF